MNIFSQSFWRACMRILRCAPLLLLFACVHTPEISVTIEVHAPETADSSTLYIAGNNNQMGDWQADIVQLENVGNHNWQSTFHYEAGTILEYKITRGSWDMEATNQDGSPFQNTVLKVETDTTVQSDVHYWKHGKAIEIQGQITGDVRFHKDFSAPALLPRDIVVWLPPNYSQNPDRRYPVLYMQDGQNIFDPKTASYQVDWQIDESADSLIRAVVIEPIIIVGINNTVQRTAEYTLTSTGSAYRTFVIETVKAFVDATYRTKPGREYTAVGGSSYGGTVAFMLAWENPHIFSKSLCMSPAFKTKGVNVVRHVRKDKGPKPDVLFYFDNGAVGLEEQLQPGIDQMMSTLDRMGYQLGDDYFWVLDQDARHFESAWAKRIPNALKLLYGVEGE